MFLSSLVQPLIIMFDNSEAGSAKVTLIRISIERLSYTCLISLLQLEWLLSGKKGSDEEEEEDFETGLDPNSYVYKAIMSNPVVQLTLTNTKSLIGEREGDRERDRERGREREREGERM